MRKLKLQMQTTVNGFVAGPNGELDWMNWENDDKMLAHVVALIDSSDTILMGRKMTDGFVQYWESVKPESPEYSFAQKMVDTPKIVFSKTVSTMVGKNVSVENGDIVEAVNKLKSQEGKDILVYGGAGFVSSLIKHNLIDELYLFVNPVAISEGMAIFTQKTNFQLVNATPFECGEALLQYKPKNIL